MTEGILDWIVVTPHADDVPKCDPQYWSPMTDPRKAAAEAAVPDGANAPEIVASMRELFSDGWDAAKADVPSRDTLHQVLELAVASNASFDELTDSVIALYAVGAHSCDNCSGVDPASCLFAPRQTPPLSVPGSEQVTSDPPRLL